MWINNETVAAGHSIDPARWSNAFAEVVLDVLEMGVWARKREGRDVTGLIHHSDRGVQYRAVRYTERLSEAEAVASVGSRSDSYGNAMAEAFNSLLNGELIHNPMKRGRGWRSINDVEIAVAEYVDWYNHRRLHGKLGQRPPVEVGPRITQQAAISTPSPSGAGDR